MWAVFYLSLFLCPSVANLFIYSPMVPNVKSHEIINDERGKRKKQHKSVMAFRILRKSLLFFNNGWFDFFELQTLKWNWNRVRRAERVNVFLVTLLTTYRHLRWSKPEKKIIRIAICFLKTRNKLKKKASDETLHYLLQAHCLFLCEILFWEATTNSCQTNTVEHSKCASTHYKLRSGWGCFTSFPLFSLYLSHFLSSLLSSV